MSSSRRQFLKMAGLTGGGLIAGVSFTGGPHSGMALAAAPADFLADAFVQITPQNTVRFYLPRDEMGQGVYMGLTTLVAEELDVSPKAIDVQFAPVGKDYDNPAYNIQGTGGSTSMAAHFYPLRQSGANTRALLLAAAAAAHDVAVVQLDTREGEIFLGEKLLGNYGDFAEAANSQRLAAPAPLKPREQFRYIGSELPRIDALAKATGTAVFSGDIELDGLKRAVVLRPPVHGGRVAAFNADAATQLPGVQQVLEIHSGVAVVADSYWQARKAAEAVEVQWQLPAEKWPSSADIASEYQRRMDSEKGTEATATGRVEDTLAGSANRHSAQFWTPYLAHATMEPMNATVRIQGGECDVWVGCQSPYLAQGFAARYSGVNREKVRIHNQFMGGGFGRRMTLTHVSEAAEIAAASGYPIQLQWSREDDMKYGVYRPASLVRIDASVGEQGRIEAWQAKRVGANLVGDQLEAALGGVVPALPAFLEKMVVAAGDKLHQRLKVDHASVEGLAEDYDWPNLSVRHVTVDHGIPVTFWRSVGHSFTAFAKEVMMDELADMAGVEPGKFRVENSGENPRLQAVIRRADEFMAGGPSQPGRFLGMAAHGSFSSYVAQVAEVSVQAGQITVHRVACVVDCGQVVNPAIVRDQMAGAIIFGLTAALYGDIEIEDGAIKQSNFHDYPILRMTESPEIEVVLVDSEEDPTGVGEPGLPPIAPAVANAVYRATGQRLRSLPLRLA
jgi:isoquinoline 1-oxidoreductase subunit beta